MVSESYADRTPEPKKQRCGARNGDGTRCRNILPTGEGRCHAHTVVPPHGIDVPAFKHGRYSRYLRLDAALRYLETRDDPDLLSLHEDVALVSHRVGELLAQVTTGESGAAWKQIIRLWKEFGRHRASGNVVKMQETLELLDEPLRAGAEAHAAWEELGLQLDRRARLADAEARRLKQMQATLTVEEVMDLLKTILDVLQRHVHDPDVLAAIGVDLEQLVTVEPTPAALSARRRRLSGGSR